MTSIIASTIEPELLGSKPRRIRLRDASGTWRSLGCLTLFSLPFVLGGLFFLYHAIHYSYVLLAGQTTSGQIVGYREDDGDLILRYRFPYRGTEYTATDRNSPIERLPPGSTISVRFDPMMPGQDSKAMLPGSPLPLNTLLSFDWAFSLAWNGVLLLLLGLLYRSARRQRHLFRFGEVAVGTITKKYVVRDERTDYKLTYEFTPLSVGLISQPPQEATANISEAEWRSLEEGAHLSVLYEPKEPRWNTPYRFGLYEILDTGSKNGEVTMTNGTVYDLIPGRRYRIRQDFQDYYQSVFPADHILTFRHRNFLPYHGGHTIEFEERNLYLQEDANADILQDLWNYLEPL